MDFENIRNRLEGLQRKERLVRDSKRHIKSVLKIDALRKYGVIIPTKYNIVTARGAWRRFWTSNPGKLGTCLCKVFHYIRELAPAPRN